MVLEEIMSNIHKHRRKFGHKHGEGFSIDYYAYMSGIRHWNASFKVAFAFLTLVLCVALDNPFVSAVVILAMGWLTVIKGGVSFHDYLSFMMIPVMFMIFGSLAIALGVSLHPTGQYCLDLNLFCIYTSDESLMKTAEIMLKAFGAISAMFMMTLSTPSNEIISVLRKAHVPKLIIELMNMIYRFIFILTEVQRKMKNSAQSRLGYDDFRTSLKSFGNIASNLFIVSLKKANAYYDALESRGYTGELLFWEEEKPVGKMQILAAGVFIGLLVCIWLLTR